MRKNFPGNIERKQKEAAERKAAYDKLTVQQKLDLLDKYGFTATRQRARLQKQLNSPTSEKKKNKKS